MHIRPANNLKVRDPDLRDCLPENGRVVPDTGYWRRRLRDGDVVSVSDPDTSGRTTPGPARDREKDAGTPSSSRTETPT